MADSAMRKLIRIERAFIGSAYAETYSPEENAAYLDECSRQLSNAWTEFLEEENRRWAARAAEYDAMYIKTAEHCMRVVGDLPKGTVKLG